MSRLDKDKCGYMPVERVCDGDPGMSGSQLGEKILNEQASGDAGLKHRRVRAGGSKSLPGLTLADGATVLAETGTRREHSEAWRQYAGAAVSDVPFRELMPLEKLELLGAAVAKHERNLERMRQESSAGAPDVSKLKDYLATAGGKHSAAYENESPYIQGLIDRFEGRFLNNASQAIAMAVGGGSAGVQYGIEMTRSRQFIEMLKSEEGKLLKGLGITGEQHKEMLRPAADGTAGGVWSTASGDTIKFVKGEGDIVEAVMMNGSKIGRLAFVGSTSLDGTLEGNWVAFSTNPGVVVTVNNGILTVRPQGAGISPIKFRKSE